MNNFRGESSEEKWKIGDEVINSTGAVRGESSREEMEDDDEVSCLMLSNDDSSQVSALLELTRKWHLYF